jgi:hypothetical protein
MGLSADEFRTLARNCLRDALFSRDEKGKQMLLDIADQYNQRAAHLDAYCIVRLDRLG